MFERERGVAYAVQADFRRDEPCRSSFVCRIHIGVGDCAERRAGVGAPAGPAAGSLDGSGEVAECASFKCLLEDGIAGGGVGLVASTLAVDLIGVGILDTREGIVLHHVAANRYLLAEVAGIVDQIERLAYVGSVDELDADAFLLGGGGSGGCEQDVGGLCAFGCEVGCIVFIVAYEVAFSPYILLDGLGGRRGSHGDDAAYGVGRSLRAVAAGGNVGLVGPYGLRKNRIVGGVLDAGEGVVFHHVALHHDFSAEQAGVVDQVEVDARLRAVYKLDADALLLGRCLGIGGKQDVGSESACALEHALLRIVVVVAYEVALHPNARLYGVGGRLRVEGDDLLAGVGSLLGAVAFGGLTAGHFHTFETELGGSAVVAGQAIGAEIVVESAEHLELLAHVLGMVEDGHIFAHN